MAEGSISSTNSMISSDQTSSGSEWVENLEGMNPYDQVCEEEAPEILPWEKYGVSSEHLVKLVKCVGSKVTGFTSMFTGEAPIKHDTSVQLDSEAGLPLDFFLKSATAMICQEPGPELVSSAEISGKLYFNDMGFDPNGKSNFRPIILGQLDLDIEIEDDLASVDATFPHSLADLDMSYDFRALNVYIDGGEVSLYGRNQKASFQVIEDVWSQLPEYCKADHHGLKCNLEKQLSAFLTDSKIDLKKLYYFLKNSAASSKSEPSSTVQLPEPFLRSAELNIDLNPGERVYRYGDDFNFAFDKSSHLKGGLKLDFDKKQHQLEFGEDFSIVLKGLNYLGFELTGQIKSGKKYEDGTINPGFRLNYDAKNGSIQAKANLDFDFSLKLPGDLPLIGDSLSDTVSLKGSLLFETQLQQKDSGVALANNATQLKLFHVRLGSKDSMPWLNGFKLSVSDMHSVNDPYRSWSDSYFKLGLSTEIPALSDHYIDLKTHLPVASQNGVYDFSDLNRAISFPETELVYSLSSTHRFKAKLSPNLDRDLDYGSHSFTSEISLTEVNDMTRANYTLLNGGYFQWNRLVSAGLYQDAFSFSVETSPNFKNAQFTLIHSPQPQGMDSWSLSAQADQVSFDSNNTSHFWMLDQPRLLLDFDYQSQGSQHTMGLTQFVVTYQQSGIEYQLSLLDNVPSRFDTASMSYHKPKIVFYFHSSKKKLPVSMIIGASDIYWAKGESLYINYGAFGKYALGWQDHIDQLVLGSEEMQRLINIVNRFSPILASLLQRHLVVNEIPENFPLDTDRLREEYKNYFKKAEDRHHKKVGSKTTSGGGSHDD